MVSNLEKILNKPLQQYLAIPIIILKLKNCVSGNLDLAKAFDIIDYLILFKFFDKFGIKEPAYEMLSSYLKNIKEFEKITP